MGCPEHDFPHGKPPQLQPCGSRRTLEQFSKFVVHDALQPRKWLEQSATTMVEPNYLNNILVVRLERTWKRVLRQVGPRARENVHL